MIMLTVGPAACDRGADLPPTPVLESGSTAPLETYDPVTDDTVSLVESTVDWETYQYELDENHGIAAGSYDGLSKTKRSFDAWILENRYLKVTLVPEIGGRILSIIYKPTGHEQLYQNPVGVPYQIDTGIFYYDWLMVYGGIFPTFPEPEHGKSWLLPWAFTVVKESEEEVTVAMSIKDDVDNPAAPRQYDLGPTGLEITYLVTLKAGRAAVDTRVQITNPNDHSAAYEYWTNATLAPGSDPQDPRTTAGAEIIAPVDKIKIPGYWTGIAAQEEAAGLAEVYEFDSLRQFENWPDMGIAYAFPDMRGGNFWGVINHDNEEGIFRIGDNRLTPGLKIWTWGYPQSSAVDPHTSADETRPYIELWAGVSREFWQRAQLPAGDRLEIEEIYSPSVGLANVTYANENFLVDLGAADPAAVHCRLFGMFPDQPAAMAMSLDGQVFFEDVVEVDAVKGNDCSTEIPEGYAGSGLNFTIESVEGVILLDVDFGIILE